MFPPARNEVSFAERFFLFFSGLSFFLDDPVGKAFHEFDPPTEMIGEIFFRTLSTSLKIPGGTISPFEICSYGLMLALFSKYRLSQRDFARQTPAYNSLLAIALLMPLSALLSAIVGVLLGGANSSFLLFQARTYPLLGAWIYIGFEISRSTKLVFTFFNIMAWCLLFKAILATFVFLGPFGGDIGDREYLMEHITSDFFTTIWVFLVASLIFVRGSLFSQLSRIGISLVMIPPYVWNERRSATIGLIFFLGHLFCLVKLETYLKIWKFIVGAVVGFAMFLAVSWNAQGPIGALARTIKSSTDTTNDTSTQYRLIENFNLLSVVGNFPLLGSGFGKRFPIIVKLADVSEAYSLFDVVPHNTILFIWAFAGPIGLGVFGTLIAAGIAMGFQIIRDSSHDAKLRVLAITSVAILIKWLVFVFADMALLEIRSIALVGICLGLTVRYSYVLNLRAKKDLPKRG